MKRTRLSFLVLVFIFALVLTSCGGNKQPDGEDQSYKKVLLEGWQEYALTYSDGASGKVSDAASDFSLALNENTISVSRLNLILLPKTNRFLQNHLKYL
jgi:hypothetical protein